MGIMDILYDDKYHLYIDFYEGNGDFKLVAFKRQNQDTRDIFFDFKAYGIENIVLIFARYF